MAASAMGLVMGSSCPFQYPQFSTSSSLCSSSSTSQSICCFYCTKTPHNRRKHMKVTARMNQEAQDGSVRRTILFVGISVLPLLKLRAADALESVTAGESCCPSLVLYKIQFSICSYELQGSQFIGLQLFQFLNLLPQ